MNPRKPQYMRFLHIDEAIRSGSYPNCNTLAQEFEVSPRTIARDMEYLRDMLDAPVEYDESRKGYYYSETNYSLPSINILESELFAVCVAEKALEQYAGTPLYDRLASAFDKIKSFLPETVRVNTSWINRHISFLDGSRTTIRPGIWETVARALRQGNSLRIVHRPPNREPIVREVDPYHLVVAQGQWYLIAHCHLKNDIRIFALSRIDEARITPVAFALPDDFDFKKYMGATFGIMAEAEEYTARILFDPAEAPYVRERIWHETQRIEENRDGSLILSFTTNSHLEVKRWVLSWGAGAKVLEPAWLAKEVHRELAAAVKRYR